MAEVTDKQYRPISTLETAVNDALSVRYCHDTANNISNYQKRVGNYKIVSKFFHPPQDGPAPATFDETLERYLGRHFIPDDCTQLRVCGNGELMAGAGSAFIYIYSSPDLYRGPAVFDASYLGDSSFVRLTFSSMTNAIDKQTLTIDAKSPAGFIYLYMTVENDHVSVSADIHSLDIQMVK